MISALAPDRPDKAFNISVLPGRAERRGPVADAHRSDASFERVAKCSVIVANKIFRHRIPRERLGDLARQPPGRRMGRDGTPNQPASAVTKHQEPKELLKRHRGDHKEINRRNSLGMIVKEGLPGLQWPTLPRHHVFRNRGLGNVDAYSDVKSDT